MRNRIIGIGFWVAFGATAAIAQTTVTTTGGTASTVPVFTGNSTLGNSVITQSGANVGIGTTTPAAPLHIYKSATGAIGGQLVLDNDGAAVANATAITFADGGIGAGTRAQLKVVTENYPFAGAFVFQTNNPIAGLGLSERMRITGVGNVGIGTIAPAYLLDVAGQVRASGGFVFPDGSTQTVAYSPNSAAVDSALAQSNGNIGIGTATPQQRLSIGGGSISVDNFGFISSLRSGDNNYTSLFLGGGIVDAGNGTYTVQGDGGADYFAAIRMDNTGNNLGGMGFYSGPSISGGNYALTNAQLASYLRMTITNGNVGIGTATPGVRLEVNGNVKLTSGSGASLTFADGTVQSTAWNGVLSGGDYAESVDVQGDRNSYEPGDVLVINPEVEGGFVLSSQAYSTAVMGIYSTKPGARGRRQKTDLSYMKDEVPMAMIGIVPTKVSAENGPIHSGDLLVTSSRPGYAMKGTDRSQMLGAVIGKALGHLDSGTGVIEVGVTLQ